MTTTIRQARRSIPGAEVIDGIIYSERDGNPLSDNTLQFEWIALLKGGFDVQYAENPDVFVAGDLLWYPVLGDNRIRTAPDVLIAFGRPKGYRGSYRQWDENDVAPQVVWEILSPANRRGEMDRKFDFYDRFGVEEYYKYDPDRRIFTGWLRGDGGENILGENRLRPILRLDGFVSPRLGIRFEIRDNEPLQIFGPNGEPFVSVVELAAQRDAERLSRERAEWQRERAEWQRERAEHDLAQAERERDGERLARERLAARLRALGIDPDAV